MKPHNLSNRFRQARMQRFLSIVAPLMRKGPVRILDIGGTADYWHALPGLYRARNAEITIANVDLQGELDDENLHVVPGDARALPFSDMAFDVVHSNSVIEHVGRWPEMEAMAGEVGRLAPAYFVQTPNYWFPLEPHFRLPFVQFMPERMRAAVVEAMRRNPTGGHSDAPALDVVRWTRLIDARQMRALFPDAAIERERFAGLTKSLIAIRRST